MVDIPTIIGITVLVIVIILILKLVKKAIKAVAIITGLIFIILIAGTYLVFLDLNDIKENLGTKQSMFVYQDEGGNILTGIYGKFGEEGEEPNYLTSDMLESFNGKSLKEIKGDFYKIFIFKQEAFDSVEAIEDFSGKRVSRADAIFLIQSDDFMEDVEKTNLKDMPFENAEQAKGMLFVFLFRQGIDENKIFLFREYKKGNVEIYPKTIVFRIIKSVPDFLIDKIIHVAG